MEYRLDVLAEQVLTIDELEETSSAFVVASQETSVEIPKEADHPVILFSESEENLAISIPTSIEEAVAEPGEFGEVSFDHGNASSTSVLPHEDGSVQMVTTIADSSAPEEYVYNLDLPEGASMEILEGGLVLVEDSAGNFIAGVAAPWAKDANGVDIPTRYEIRGSALVQIVKHQNRSNLKYPVTADPWLGRDLISRVWVTIHHEGYKVNVAATSWGRAFNGVATHKAHVDELVSKTAQGRITPTIREQYLCHVAGNLFEREYYNMESWLPYKPWWQQLNLVDQCNPGGSRYS
ncbi:hypothetical protein A7979_10265 [Rothia nasimurium]|uniref:DUF2599 domain-containing protein n=1 Tax=Rothia nasimurium TaxID=85336 RepID=A0A1Y1RRY2_9MICC|nr:DUF2599 domain-containing protein [Rothia nasimurium]ORC24368.1 hypothetical protein A7979_10265 [Rothia nasimurium]